MAFRDFSSLRTHVRAPLFATPFIRYYGALIAYVKRKFYNDVV